MSMAQSMQISEIADMIGEHDIRIWRVVKYYVKRPDMNYFNSKITNSVVQLLKRSARGYRNIPNFIIMIYLRLGHLKFQLPT
jgi:transposase